MVVTQMRLYTNKKIVRVMSRMEDEDRDSEQYIQLLALRTLTGGREARHGSRLRDDYEGSTPSSTRTARVANAVADTPGSQAQSNGAGFAEPSESEACESANDPKPKRKPRHGKVLRPGKVAWHDDDAVKTPLEVGGEDADL